MFKNLRFFQKIMLILGITSILVILGIGSATYIILKNDLEKRIAVEMKQIIDSTYNMIETTMNTAIKNYLKGIAEKTLGVAKYNYNLYKKGKISEKEAYKRLKEYILSPYTVRIGKTGYNSAISGNDGVLEMHPRSEGFDASDQEFMQKAMKMKNGYLEYVWKNIHEETPRKKAGYLLYFKPWDLILWPTAYKDELYELVDPKELTEKLVNIRVRKSGYVSVLDKDAKIIVHPYMAKGEDTIDSQDKKNGNYFILEIMKDKERMVKRKERIEQIKKAFKKIKAIILEKKGIDTKIKEIFAKIAEIKRIKDKLDTDGGVDYGTIRYYWKNEREKEAREKIVFYKHYEKLDWLICSGVYLDELYEPVNNLRNTLVIISIIVLIVIVLFSIFIGTSISRPVKQLAEGAEAIGRGKLDVVIPLKSKDEIGLLANTFNKMTSKLKTSRELLKQAKDKVEKANNAKSIFLANMSHEIRTPLTSILGNAELLTSHLSEDPNITLVENIKSSTKTLKDFLDNTLHMSRIEARKLKINIAAVNIYSILHEIRNNFSFQINQKELEYVEDIDPALPQHLDLDKVRLKQVLINLVSNAVKYTEKGCVKLTAGVKENRVDNSKIDLVIAVEDTGIGIPEENRQKIFEPYERRETNDGENQEGSGLGLAISRGIIELMGGEISVDSEPGSGSTFTILIRNVNVSQDENEINDEDGFDYSSIVFDRQKLLIADDKKETRRIIKGYLEGSRIQVLEAENGKRAVKMTKEHKPDLILMDLKMPVMNGIEATKQIREDEELKAVPIFAFTASKTDPDDVAKYRDLFESYIFKPISKAKLFFELIKFLKHKRPGEKEEKSKLPAEFTRIKLSAENRKIMPDIINQLEGYKPTWESALKNNNLNKYKNFGQKIKELGEKYNLQVLSDYGDKIITNTEMSKVRKIKMLLEQYPVLIEKLNLI